MSTPQQQIPKGPRRSSRRQKHTAPEGSQHTVAASDNDSNYHSHTVAHVGEDNRKQKRKSQANKMVGDAAEDEIDRSKNHSIPVGKTKATPIKQAAYAGPTFHQSPAASALPLPKFYSQSVPNVSTIKPPNTIDNGGARPQEHSQSPEHSNELKAQAAKRESTPLDFLFDAARKAKSPAKNESPTHRASDQRAPSMSPSVISPAAREGESMFPFELDGGVKTPVEAGSPFSTPFKDRMEALKSTKPTPEGSRTMDEAERKAKSDELKKMLFQVQSQGQPAHGLPATPDSNNPFNARPAPSQSTHDNHQRQHRNYSGPSTPVSSQSPQFTANHSQYFPQYAGNGAPSYALNHYRTPSALRNVYGPSHAEPEVAELSTDGVYEAPRISTARKHSHQHTPKYKTADARENHNNVKGYSANQNIQQMEDDLRRVLKLDVISTG